jgi:predicted anti-sigma-YlaC factor YlaD
MNSAGLNAHLSDDQFVDCAAGLEISAEAAAHLRECSACREELAGFGAAVDSFNRAAREWSEARPMGSLRERSWGGRPVLGMAAVALAACIMLVAGVTAVRHHEEARRPADVAQVAGSQGVAESQGDSEAQIAQDNKLLMAVDVALRDDEPSPVEEYALQRIAAAHAKAQGAAGTAPAAKEGKATNQ